MVYSNFVIDVFCVISRIPESNYAESNDLLGDVFVDTISSVSVSCYVNSINLFHNPFFKNVVNNAS